jgi:hypothetical protein
MIKTDGKFYIGRIFDPKQGKAAGEPVFYYPADLTTHAAVVGMTGSGKTGLCIDLLEEAALQGIPAMMIDPKGDITNTCFTFPISPQLTSNPGWIRMKSAGQEKPWKSRRRDRYDVEKRPGLSALSCIAGGGENG